MAVQEAHMLTQTKDRRARAKLLAHMTKARKGENMSNDWDGSEYLETREDIYLYLKACFAEAGTDSSIIAMALGEIAHSRGLEEIARETGLGKSSLTHAMSGEGNPSLATIALILRSLGLQLTVKMLNP
jgi:probable addiction module antidote protein